MILRTKSVQLQQTPTTLLLIFYCVAGTTSAPLTFRLVDIFINSEIFTDRNLIKALMCLFKLTEKASLQ